MDNKPQERYIFGSGHQARRPCHESARLAATGGNASGPVTGVLGTGAPGAVGVFPLLDWQL